MLTWGESAPSQAQQVDRARAPQDCKPAVISRRHKLRARRRGGKGGAIIKLSARAQFETSITPTGPEDVLQVATVEKCMFITNTVYCSTSRLGESAQVGRSSHALQAPAVGVRLLALHMHAPEEPIVSPSQLLPFVPIDPPGDLFGETSRSDRPVHVRFPLSICRKILLGDMLRMEQSAR